MMTFTFTRRIVALTFLCLICWAPACHPIKCEGSTRHQKKQEGNDSKHRTFHFCSDSLGQQQGPFVILDEEGNRISAGTYKDGILEGTWSAWYPTGEIQIRGRYQNGKMHGQWRYYHRNGRMALKGRYQWNKQISSDPQSPEKAQPTPFIWCWDSTGKVVECMTLEDDLKIWFWLL